ncbi:MAG: hypothetical protein ACJ76H_10350 [Bacteriovoracaceae bacterium]|jgi:predicted membrane channel-forming protein YqfA (hemolysin III family)
MLQKLNDLLFVIGLFLTIIGLIVFFTGIVSQNDLVQGIRVNLFGGGMMSVIGFGMVARSFVKA